ncbi:MAG: hypothetical protein HRT35_17715 [Algicola sp.]|nr:hypothetical protein [Algicola sp.]
MASNNNEIDQESQPATVEHVPLPKYYVFNETGNIMLCTTGSDTHNLSDAFKNICGEVSVFFAAMTKAIHSATNPRTNLPYSIYNHQALQNVIDNSGVFISINQQKLKFRSDKVGDQLSKGLLKTLLGCEFGNAGLNFARAMFEGVGKEATCMSNPNETAKNDATGHTNSAGNLFFICESLLGMSIISAVLVHIKSEDSTEPLEQIVNFRENHPAHVQKERTWTFNKSTYMFVAPKFFKAYAQDLNDVNSPEFMRYVQNLGDGLRKMV